MKILRTATVISLMALPAAPIVLAADTAPPPATWHAQTPLQALGYVVLFALVGVFAAIICFKLFDKFTPGHLGREIVEHRNVAAAIIGAAVILGVCIIVAASIAG